MNSINTNSGNNPVGQPAGTKIEKNLPLCLKNPSIVDPTTIVKLIKNVKMK